MRPPRLSRSGTMALFAVGISGCAALLGIDEDYVIGSDASAGNGGASGSMAGAGGLGGEAAAGGADASGGEAAAIDGAAGAGGSDASADADAGAGGFDPCDISGTGCPVGLPGPPMIEVPLALGAGSYCIDAHEVTNADYTLFLNSVPGLFDQLPPCLGPNLSFFPADWPPPVEADALPVTGVDWCDALQFCRWAGKRLCGRIGGGANLSVDYADITRSQWFNACTAVGTRAYPYGDSYDPMACNGADQMLDRPVPFTDLPTCRGGCSELRHMSGNVGEWEDSCTAGGGVFDCRVRGGSYRGSDTEVACSSDNDRGFLSESPDVGFRCCT